MYIRASIRHPPDFFMELPQILAILVQIATPVVFVVVRMACPLRLGASGGGIRAAFDVRGACSDGSGHSGDVDHHRGSAGLLREAEEGVGGGREEDYERDCWDCDEDFVEGRELGGCWLCCFGVFCTF